MSTTKRKSTSAPKRPTPVKKPCIRVYLRDSAGGAPKLIACVSTVPHLLNIIRRHTGKSLSIKSSQSQNDTVDWLRLTAKNVEDVSIYAMADNPHVGIKFHSYAPFCAPSVTERLIECPHLSEVAIPELPPIAPLKPFDRDFQETAVAKLGRLHSAALHFIAAPSSERLRTFALFDLTYDVGEDHAEGVLRGVDSYGSRAHSLYGGLYLLTAKHLRRHVWDFALLTLTEAELALWSYHLAPPDFNLPIKLVG